MYFKDRKEFTLTPRYEGVLSLRTEETAFIYVLMKQTRTAENGKLKLGQYTEVGYNPSFLMTNFTDQFLLQELAVSQPVKQFPDFVKPKICLSITTLFIQHAF